MLNNIGDGMVKQWQKLFFKGRLVGVATSRCTRRTSSRPRRPTASNTRCASTARPTCRASSQEFLAFKGPAFLEVMIDPDAGVYPMVGPGQPYEAMITGPHIPARSRSEIKAPGPSEMF